jgi:hypothetical protein
MRWASTMTQAPLRMVVHVLWAFALTAVILVSSILAPSFARGARRAARVSCGKLYLGPSPVDYVYNLRPQGVSCRVARQVARRSRKAGASFDVRLRYRSAGFSCRGRFVEPPSGGKGHIGFGCSRGRARIMFDHN